jgi:hypothetical protein
MVRQSKPQKETVERVMHEFKHGELESGTGRKVKNPKQAIAIALRESGSSKYESKKENERNLRRTKRRERAAATGRDRTEGKGSRRAAGGREETRAQLYQEAKRRNIPGRSKMTKEQLERALKS